MIKKEQFLNFVEHLEKGLSPTDAAAASGFSKKTYDKWKEKKDPRFAQCEKAILKTKIKCIDAIFASGQWTSFAWWLERKFSDEYALKNKTELSGSLKTENVQRTLQKVISVIKRNIADPKLRDRIAEELKKAEAK